MNILTKCVTCHKSFDEDDGMYNSPIGWVCIKCGENKPWLNARKNYLPRTKNTNKEFKIKDPLIYPQPKITIGSYSVDGALLKKYVKCVAYLRYTVSLTPSNIDPLTIQNALRRRENIHRQIFKSVKLHHHSHPKATKESKKFYDLLDVWLTIRLGEITLT